MTKESTSYESTRSRSRGFIERGDVRIFYEVFGTGEPTVKPERGRTDGPGRYDWQEGEPPWEVTLSNGLWHPAGQLTTCYLKRGDKQAARHLQEMLLAAVLSAKLPREELGVAIYNQVCYYATNGWPK